jgi:hypothetical protein
MSIIKNKDIYDPSQGDPLKPLYDMLTKLDTKIEATKGKMNTLEKAVKDVNKTGSGAEAKALIDNTQKLQIETGKLNNLQGAKSKIDQALKVNQEILNRQTKENIKLKSALTGAYEKESIRLNQLRRAYKDLAVAEKGATKEGQALLRQITVLDKKLKDIDASAGQFQRSVGNYEKALHGLSSELMSAGGITLGVAGAIQAFQNFEKRASELSTITNRITNQFGITGKSAQDLSSTIHALSNNFGKDYNEVLTAANAVSKALGISLDEALSNIEEGFKKGSDPYNLGNYIYVRELPNGEIRYRVTFEGKEKIFKNKDEAIKHRDNLVSEKSVSVQKELGNKKFISNEDFKKLFIEKKLSDKDFANFLNEQGYVTDKKGLFTDSAVNSRRTRNDISSFVQEQRIQNVSEEGILKRAEDIDAFNPNTGNVEKGELLRQYKAGVIPDLDTLLNKVQQREGTSSRTQKAKEDPEFRKIMLDRQRKSVEKMRSTPEGLERLRETQRKYRAKVALELGAPPPPKDNRERFWLDLYQTAFRAEKGGIDSAIKFADYAPKKYPSMNVVKGTTLIDSNTGEKLTFKNIENFINTYKPK